MRSPVATAIAIATGVLLLISTFIQNEMLFSVRAVLLNIAIILAASAGLIAILNLVGVHWRKLRAPRNRDGYSLIMLIGFTLTFLAAIILGPSNPQVQNIITHIQLPIEASLMAVVGISLIYAAMRLFQRRKNLMAVVFIISALIFLVIASGFLAGFGEYPMLANVLAIINRLPIAGARGILLGVALGSLLTGLRVLVAADRPYTG